MKTAQDFLGLKPTKDFALKLWNGLEKCNSQADRDSLEGFRQIESDSFSHIMIQYFPELQSSEESEIYSVEKFRCILAQFVAVNYVAFAEVNFFYSSFGSNTNHDLWTCVQIHGSNMCCLYLIIWPWLHGSNNCSIALQVYTWIHLWIPGS